MSGYGIKPDMEQAVNLLQESATQNFNKVQYELAQLYEKGYGVDKDINTAIDFYNKAANNNEPHACFRLAILYEDKMEVENNIDEALKWYNRAADLKHPYALYNLAKIYFKGDYMQEVDLKKAFEIYQKCAEMEVTEAQYRLGCMYYYPYIYSNIVEEDVDKAKELFEKAAERGLPQAIYELANIYNYRYINYNNYEKAYKLYNEASKKGIAEAYEKMGDMCRDGNGVERDYNKTIDLYIDSIENGNLNSSIFDGLGRILVYHERYLHESNTEKAIECLRKYADKRNASALYCMAKFYNYGYCVTRNAEKAIDYYTMYINNSHNNGLLFEKSSYYELGLIYYEELFDYEKAFHCFSKYNDISGYYKLGLMYYDGQGMEMNINIAIAWFVLATFYYNNDPIDRLNSIYENSLSNNDGLDSYIIKCEYCCLHIDDRNEYKKNIDNLDYYYNSIIKGLDTSTKTADF